MIDIPKDIHLGKGLLEKELPWFAPGAIIWLDEHLTKDMTVLEFGAGGSTPFFARRCKYLHTIEASGEWISMVNNYLAKNSIKNVSIGKIIPGYKLLAPSYSDVVLIDSPIRSNFESRESILEKIIPVKPKIIIVDDFARLNIPEEIPGYYTIRFLDSRWKGKGVQIYVLSE